MKRGKSLGVFLVLIILGMGFIGFVSATTETKTFTDYEIYGLSQSNPGPISNCPCSVTTCDTGGYYADDLTAKALCKLKGYEDKVSFTISSPFYSSPGDNYMRKSSDETTFQNICAEGNNIGIDTVTCIKNLCTPATCSSLEKECGSWDNGCGGNVACGDCSINCPAPSTNVALNKPVTATGTVDGTNVASHAVDGNLGTWWGTGNCGSATLTIDLQTEQSINNYSISCGGIAHGNNGTIKFYNAADVIVAQKDYVCDLKGASSGLTGIFSPAINVNKVIIDAQSNGNDCNCFRDPLPANCGDWINLVEFEAYQINSCTPIDTGKICSSEGRCVSAAHTCTSPNQVIMKLSQYNNALGALWNDTSFTYDICYDEIFGENYTGVNLRDCTGNNKVLNLQQASNSVAEIPSLNNYNNPVCYGNLVCHNETSVGDNCRDLNEKIVVRLNTETNSQTSNASDLTFPIKICCRKGALGNSSWENMNGVQITSANVSDSVRLVVRGEVQDRMINYTVYKQCVGLECIPAFFFGDKKITQLPAKGYAIWKTTENGNFYFIAKILDDNGFILRTIDSSEEPNGIGILSVSGYNNSVPRTQIIKPYNESNYLLNYIINSTTSSTGSISYEQISSDEDDDLNATWDFGDGSEISISNCLTTGNCNTTHNYTSFGTKVIGLIVQEMTRTQKARDFTRIFVYRPGLNAFAIIDEPHYDKPISGGGIFRIDGRSSHVANCSVTRPECESSSKPCYQINDTIEPTLNLWCYKHALSNQLVFKWTLDNVINTEHTTSAPFDETFTTSGDHIIKLKVTYNY